jgi:hypothetical protein
VQQVGIKYDVRTTVSWKEYIMKYAFVLLLSTFEALQQNNYKKRLLVLHCLSVCMEKERPAQDRLFFFVGFQGWDLYKTFPQIPILVKT